ncbi:hypothetical protein ACWPM1_09680 [Tsuneonella sp. HG249]
MEFWTAFGAIAQAAGAIATVAAVVVSLNLARAASRPKLYMAIDYERDFDDDDYESIAFHLANVGSVSAKIVAIGWEIGWIFPDRRLAEFDPADGLPVFPHILEPGESICFNLSIPRTLAEMARHPKLYRRKILPGLSAPRRLIGIAHLWSGPSPRKRPSTAVLGRIAGKDRDCLVPVSYRVHSLQPHRNFD